MSLTMPVAMFFMFVRTYNLSRVTRSAIRDGQNLPQSSAKDSGTLVSVSKSVCPTKASNYMTQDSLIELFHFFGVEGMLDVGGDCAPTFQDLIRYSLSVQGCCQEASRDVVASQTIGICRNGL